MEAAVASDECEDLNAMGEEDTKTSGAPPLDSTDKEKENKKSSKKARKRHKNTETDLHPMNYIKFMKVPQVPRRRTATVLSAKTESGMRMIALF